MAEAAETVALALMLMELTPTYIFLVQQVTAHIQRQADIYALQAAVAAAVTARQRVMLVTVVVVALVIMLALVALLVAQRLGRQQYTAR
jgi:hypothetical protein